MNVGFNGSFRTALERIDNKLMIDRCVISGGSEYKPEVVCHDNIIQVCLVGVTESTCNRLDFYYQEGSAFYITGTGIVLNPNRTIFEITSPVDIKATVSCSWLTEDTKFLEGIGTEYGYSLYKDIEVSGSSLVWKESVGKYAVDRGQQDNHSYDIELIDTKSGEFFERPIRFKSYQNIIIEQGNFEIDSVREDKTVTHDVYSDVSSQIFYLWDSPMIDATVNLDNVPSCAENFNKFVEPGEIIFGNEDCFQYASFQSGLVGFRITGTAGSSVEVLMNKESTEGDFIIFSGTVEENGVINIKVDELPYYHLNGVRALGSSKVTKIEAIINLTEVVDEYIPNPDKTYVARLSNQDTNVKISGVCDYIEYENYLGVVSEIGRGTEHINSIPGICIEKIDENNRLESEVDPLLKQIIVKKNPIISSETRYCIYQVCIKNNIEVKNGVIMSDPSPLYSDYKIKVEQVGTTWKFETYPNYINDSDGNGIYVFDYRGGVRTLKIITNQPNPGDLNLEGMDDNIFLIDESTDIEPSPDKELIDEELWTAYYIDFTAKFENDSDNWRPQTENGNPFKIDVRLVNSGEVVLSFYAIQVKKIEDNIEIWEETLTPGKFTKVDDKITIYNSLSKNFIVTKKERQEGETKVLNWYYYDTSGDNKFYQTDLSLQITNTGLEHLRGKEFDDTIISLGSDGRKIYGRVLNVNRSDIIGSIGSLTASESTVPLNSWRQYIDANSVSVGVERALTNIYIMVGESSGDLHNEDITIELSEISRFSIYIKSNFKYIINTYGYIKIQPETQPDEIPSSSYPTERRVFTGYNSDIPKETHFVLDRLDQESEMGESFIEIRSWNIIRRIQVNISNPKKKHDYLVDPDIPRPNLIRIFANGTLTPGDTNSFVYRTTTTPKIEGVGVSVNSVNTSSFFGQYYRNHSSDVSLTIPNASTLWRSRYPMKSFGSIQESSMSYPESETIGNTSGIVGEGSLKFPLFMTGMDHCIWCVYDINSGFTDIEEPEFTAVTEERTIITEDDTEETIYITKSWKAETEKDIYIDTNDEEGQSAYIVSRYPLGNTTFITNLPKDKDTKIRMNDLEVEMKVSPQQKIDLDDRTQIEYAIPISIKCNFENNGGNVFLGSFNCSAETKITDGSVKDIIDLDNVTINKEGINGEYIKNNITLGKLQTLSFRVFQKGINTSIFDIFSNVQDLKAGEDIGYIVPEIGSNIILDPNEFSCIYEISPNDTEELEENHTEKVCLIEPECNTKYFLVTVKSRDRVSEDGYAHWHRITFDAGSSVSTSLPRRIVNDTHYTVTTRVNFSYRVITAIGHQSETINFKEFTSKFKKYGYYYGFYIEGAKVKINSSETVVGNLAGFGNYKSYNIDNAPVITIPAEGGTLRYHAGMFYTQEGFAKTEALMVPQIYSFSGDVTPSYSWENGNLDGNGNLVITVPPRARGDFGKKRFVLNVSRPDNYYPINLYVIFEQDYFQKEIEPAEDIKNFKIRFVDSEVNVYSDGTPAGSDKLYFTHNLGREDFDYVKFSLKDGLGSEGLIPRGTGEEGDGPDDLRELEEVERSYDEGYVKFKYKPNGSRTLIHAYIVATYRKLHGDLSAEIGQIRYNQGYYCLQTVYRNPYMESKDSALQQFTYSISRISPKQINLYKKVDETTSETEIVKYGMYPCKSNKDNSHASFLWGGRGVFKVTSYKKEFNEGQERVINLHDVFKEIYLSEFYPDYAFSSYSLSYIEESITDYDAKVDPIYFGDMNYCTDTNFSDFLPYFEVNFECKEDYIRQYINMSTVGQFTLLDPDSGGDTNFFFSTGLYSSPSDEPENEDYNIIDGGEWDWNSMDNKISIQLVNERTETVAVNGEIVLRVRKIDKIDETKVSIVNVNANLPGYSSKTNKFVINGGSSSQTYIVECTCEEDMGELRGYVIQDCLVYTRVSLTDKSPETYKPYVIKSTTSSGSPTFGFNKIYKITFVNR